MCPGLLWFLWSGFGQIDNQNFKTLKYHGCPISRFTNICTFFKLSNYRLRACPKNIPGTWILRKVEKIERLEENVVQGVHRKRFPLCFFVDISAF